MIEFLKIWQLDIMLALSSICAVIALLAWLNKTLPKKRKYAMIYLQVASSLLMLFDRFAYIYSGNESFLGFWVVRICNLAVFMLILNFLHAINIYITDLFANTLKVARPHRLQIAEGLVSVGWLLIIISQFTGMYYSFDANNVYSRGPLYPVAYAIPMAIFLLHLSLIIQYYGQLGRKIRLPLLMFYVVPLTASLIQLKFYGLSLINIAAATMSIVLYVFVINEMNETLDKEAHKEIDNANKEVKKIDHALEQIIKTVSSAVDSTDYEARGHSVRVANYSKMLARRAGLNEEQCHEVYYAALLHDIGLIGIGRKDPEEIKKHTTHGGEILSAVKDFPFLATVAKYHHERYDGNGYPEGLIGNDIPLYARIVAVADEYDNLTSETDMNEPQPQGKVREAMVTGANKKFDPVYSQIMIKMIDEDTEFTMRPATEVVEEEKVVFDLSQVKRTEFREYKHKVFDGIKLTRNIVKISFDWVSSGDAEPKNSLPAFVLFDSIDGCVQTNERTIKAMKYLEFGELWFDGKYISTKARAMTVDVEGELKFDGKPVHFEVAACKYKDHSQIKIKAQGLKITAIMALPDTSRNAFMGFTGENCTVSHISVEETQKEITEEYIPRIAKEINIINLADGDVPNIQADSKRSATTEGVPVFDGVRLAFHTKSLPASYLVSNCPYVLLYTSDDGKYPGKNYRELACIRLDGEDVTDDETAQNELTVSRGETFPGWDAWKQNNRNGYESEVLLIRRRNKVRMVTQNCGIEIKNITSVPKGTDQIYAALTGDQCAIMDIRALYEW